MVDVSEKGSTVRRAVASGRVLLAPATVKTLRSGQNPKGDPLEIAALPGSWPQRKPPS